jgi:hypothetical protein
MSTDRSLSDMLSVSAADMAGAPVELVPGGHVVELCRHVSAATREALRLPDYITKENLSTLIGDLKKTPDSAATFPKGKWATIQHLEGLLLSRDERGNR